ncbi:MAG: DUF2336 domain-containing protein [Alphaproteobacteria bacterium]
MCSDLELAVEQANALGASERRALLLRLVAQLLDERTGAAERRRLSEVINRIAATLELKMEMPLDSAACEERLLALLRAGEREMFTEVFAALAGITKVDAAALLNGGADGRIAQACRDMGLPREAYSAIVVLSDPARAPGQTEALLRLYDYLPPPPHITHEAA